MKKVFGFLKPYRLQCVLAPLFKMLEATFELLVPVVVASIIDRGIGEGDTPHVLRMCGILALLAVVGYASAVTAQYFASVAAMGFSAATRLALFKKVQSLSYTELDTLGTATIVARMTSDVGQAQTGVNITLRLLLRSPFVVFGAMIGAALIDGKTALTFGGVILLLMVAVFAIMYFTVPLYRKSQNKLDRVLDLTRENLLGVRVIRAFCMEEGETKAFDEANTALTRAHKRVGLISALTNPVTYVLINLGIIALLYTGAVEVNVGNLTQGQVIALYNYMSQILVELVKFANLIVTVTKSVASGKRIEQMLHMTSSMEEVDTLPTPILNAPAIAFENVALTYAGSQEPALDGVTFTLAKGGVLGVIGGTGSGKSTLVNLIPRFYDATQGSVRIAGVDVKEYPLDALRDRIGVVPQKATLFAGTIRDNLKWGNPNATDEELWDALRLAQAVDVVESKPKGLDEWVEAGGRNFSGGQRQRLTIARALVRKPDILILDDSASALDYATDAALRRSLKGLTDTSVVVVSQRASSVRHADLTIVLDDGVVVGMGTHEELLHTCPVYQEICSSQEKGGDEA